MMDRFVTLAAGVLDSAKHTVTFINAGHMTPLIYRAAFGKLEDGTNPDVAGLPLGVLDNYQYASHQADLKPGDSVLLFTDGITDALNVQGQPFQTKGIHQAVGSGRSLTAPPLTPAELGERVVKAVKQHAAGRSQHDDIA